jgi:hypothetical protein
MRRLLPTWFAVAACTPLLDDPTPYLDDPRVLAVRFEPAEAAPRDAVAVTAFAADSEGEVTTLPVDWSFCLDPKPLAELGPVSPECLDPAGDGWAPVGAGLAFTAVLPEAACSLFGPNPPPPEPGQPAGRPTDPDVTGGYHQPLVGDVDGALTLASVRVRCGLADVSQEAYVDWNRAYRSNENPVVDALFADDGTGPAEVGPVLDVAPGQTVTLRVAWPDCPASTTCGDGICGLDEDTSACAADCTDPVGCGGAETYVVYDRGADGLVTRREAMSATWYATAGSWDEARTGRAGDDPETQTSNVWTAPESGDAWLGVVLRDERGGVAWRSVRVVGAR